MKYLLYEKDHIYYSEKNEVYHKDRVLTIKDLKLKYFPNILKRLFRIGVFKLAHDDLHFIVVIKKKILIYIKDKLFSTIDIEKGSRPLKDGLCLINRNIFYGDYWGNKDRVPVNIYKIDLMTGAKDVFYSFYHIRHIHFIQPDKLDEDYLLIGTGDLNNESGIYRLNIITKELIILGEGAQKYRAVSIIQRDNVLIWGSDDPDSDNYIYKFYRDTQILKRIRKIDGPSYYSTENKKGDMFIATTIENRQRHKAIIYKSSDEGQNWSIYKEFKKDIWSSKYFGYGVIEFIDGQEKYEKLLYNTVGLKETNENI